MHPGNPGTFLSPGELPAQLRHNALRTPGGAAWLRELEARITEQCDHWNVRRQPVDGQFWFAGHAGVVVPVVDANGRQLALKYQIPAPELATEAAALRLWSGNGAVRLIRDEAGFLLLERLDPDRDIARIPPLMVGGIWGAVMRQLSQRVAELPGSAEDTAPFERTDAVAERWNDDLPARWADRQGLLPRRLLEAGLELCQTRGAVGRRDGDDFLVHADLHYFNVLARPETDEYVAIDPQMYIGDREFAVLPMLDNRLGELPVREPAAALRARLRQLSDAAGLDADLATGWSIVRAVEDVLSYSEQGLPQDAERSLWVASALSHGDVSVLPDVHQLKPLV
ncbi:aminoglycoside resistance protein [Micrococcaceae bacterium RIT802]|nr:aminoglycoside resistance protein [Micrococcaceae bacterium RIT 802]